VNKESLFTKDDDDKKILNMLDRISVLSCFSYRDKYT